MTREEEIYNAMGDAEWKHIDGTKDIELFDIGFKEGAEWADAHPKPVVIPMEDIEEFAKEVVTKDWQEQQDRLFDMIERNYRAYFMRSACKWLEQHLHHDNVGGFWADATSVEDFINQFKSSCSDLPNNMKGD